MAEKEWVKFDASNELGLKDGDEVEVRFPKAATAELYATKTVKLEVKGDQYGFYFTEGREGDVPVWIKLERVEVAKPSVEGG